MVQVDFAIARDIGRKIVFADVQLSDNDVNFHLKMQILDYSLLQTRHSFTANPTACIATRLTTAYSTLVHLQNTSVQTIVSRIVALMHRLKLMLIRPNFYHT